VHFFFQNLCLLQYLLCQLIKIDPFRLVIWQHHSSLLQFVKLLQFVEPRGD
jgi:hypothetical protein